VSGSREDGFHGRNTSKDVRLLGRLNASAPSEKPSKNNGYACFIEQFPENETSDTFAPNRWQGASGGWLS
jgi:hypothetical protein